MVLGRCHASLGRKVSRAALRLAVIGLEGLVETLSGRVGAITLLGFRSPVAGGVRDHGRGLCHVGWHLAVGVMHLGLRPRDARAREGA